MSQTLKLKGGTLIHVGGIPATLAGDTDVETANYDALRAFSTVPFVEYPKMLPDGRIVNSAEEERPSQKLVETPFIDAAADEIFANAIRHGAVPKDPLDDVSVEMDDPTFDAPTAKRTAHKKR